MDETHFFDARFSDKANNTNTDPLTGVSIGRTVVLRAYVNNDTAVDPRDPAASDIIGARVRFSLQPSTTVDQLADREWVLQPQAFLSAGNAATVEDGVNLVGPEAFALQYVAGSAQLLRNNNSYPLSDEIVGSKGALIGLLYMNGDLPAGNSFDASALIELRARVVAVAPPEITVVSQVRMTGSRPWHDALYAKPGDDVQWLLNTTNGNWSTVYHVVTRDVLPQHLQLDAGSVTFINARGTEPLADRPLFGGGYNAGAYNRRDNTLITFKTKVLGDFSGCRLRVRNLGYARSDQTPVEVTGASDVVITKPNCPH